jgi:hypothetical protein
MSRTKVEKNHIVSISNNLLRNIEKDTTKNNTYTKSISEDAKVIRNKELINDGKSEVNLIYGSPVWADTVPEPKENAMKREGWHYNNKSLNDKMNLYMFDGTQETFTLGQLQYIYGKMFIDSWNFNVRNLPFFNVYTKPTGVNDAGAFYHSRITYDMSLGINTPKIGISEECYFFGKQIPNDDKKWFSNRAIGVSNETKLGDCLDSEEILYITLSTDTGADILGVNLCVQEMGFSYLVSQKTFNRKIILKGFQGDDIVHHDNILKDFTLNSTQNTLTDPIRVDVTHGNISWWVQSTGVVTSNHIGVQVQVSHDGIYYETIALNSKFVQSDVGVSSVFGNIIDFKPTFVRLRVTNNDNTNNDIFNVYISY